VYCKIFTIFDFEQETIMRCFRYMCPLILGMAIAVPNLGMAQTSTFEQSIDRPGSDYHNFSMSNPDVRTGATACRNECLKDQRCRAWSYVKVGIQGPMARCWMKQAAPSSARNQCCISGVVTRAVARPATIDPGTATVPADD
jgi:hypothetical protein